MCIRNWKQQFIDALSVKGGDDEEAILNNSVCIISSSV